MERVNGVGQVHFAIVPGVCAVKAAQTPALEEVEENRHRIGDIHPPIAGRVPPAEPVAGGAAGSGDREEPEEAEQRGKPVHDPPRFYRRAFFFWKNLVDRVRYFLACERKNFQPTFSKVSFSMSNPAGIGGWPRPMALGILWAAFCAGNGAAQDPALSFRKPQFVRGDANADRRVDIADALFSLIHLFGGELRPTCRAALDSNGDE